MMKEGTKTILRKTIINYMEKITIDDFAKCDIRIGTILSVDIVEGADKLLKLMIDLGETTQNELGELVSSPRQILSGIREFFPDIHMLVGKQVPVLTNLLPRTIRGHESNGMVLYAVGEGENFTVLCPHKTVPVGTLVR